MLDLVDLGRRGRAHLVLDPAPHEIAAPESHGQRQREGHAGQQDEHRGGDNRAPDAEVFQRHRARQQHDSAARGGGQQPGGREAAIDGANQHAARHDAGRHDAGEEDRDANHEVRKIKEEPLGQVGCERGIQGVHDQRGGHDGEGDLHQPDEDGGGTQDPRALEPRRQSDLVGPALDGRPPQQELRDPSGEQGQGRADGQEQQAHEHVREQREGLGRELLPGLSEYVLYDFPHVILPCSCSWRCGRRPGVPEPQLLSLQRARR